MVVFSTGFQNDTMQGPREKKNDISLKMLYAEVKMSEKWPTIILLQVDGLQSGRGLGVIRGCFNPVFDWKT